MRRLLVVLLAGAALAVPSAATAQTTLHGYITGQGAISVCTTHPCGANVVTQLAPGAYVFMVHDTAAAHDFTLGSFSTPTEGTGEFTSPPMNLTPGSYTYFCSVHPFISGSFTVTGATPPAAPPPPSPPPPSPPPPAASVIDTRPPNTRIASGPAARTRAATATFRLRSTEPGSRFRCKLDRGRWHSCGATKTYRNLRRGSHTFRARAIDAAGNRDATPARRSWRRL